MGSEAAISQGMPATARNWNGQKEGFSPRAFKGSTEDLWLQNSERVSFCSFQVTQLVALCYSSPRKTHSTQHSRILRQTRVTLTSEMHQKCAYKVAQPPNFPQHLSTRHKTIYTICAVTTTPLGTTSSETDKAQVITSQAYNFSN